MSNVSHQHRDERLCRGGGHFKVFRNFAQHPDEASKLVNEVNGMEETSLCDVSYLRYWQYQPNDLRCNLEADLIRVAVRDVARFACDRTGVITGTLLDKWP